MNGIREHCGKYVHEWDSHIFGYSLKTTQQRSRTQTEGSSATSPC